MRQFFIDIIKVNVMFHRVARLDQSIIINHVIFLLYFFIIFTSNQWPLTVLCFAMERKFWSSITRWSEVFFLWDRGQMCRRFA